MGFPFQVAVPVYPVSDEALKDLPPSDITPISETFDEHQEDDINTQPPTPDFILESWPCSDLDDASDSLVEDEDDADYPLNLATLKRDGAPVANDNPPKRQKLDAPETDSNVRV